MPHTVRLLIGVALALAACTGEPKLRTITVDEVEQRLGRPGVYVFDANLRDVYDRGHVPGARWVQYDQVGADVLPSDKNATLVFYCANEH